MIPKHRKPTHPGELLLQEFLEPMGLSQVELAHRMGVPVQRVNTLINAKRDVTAETAILLSRVLKTTPEFWMNLQGAHDLSQAYETLLEDAFIPAAGDIVADEPSARSVLKKRLKRRVEGGREVRYTKRH